jgi:hypothetical protein
MIKHRDIIKAMGDMRTRRLARASTKTLAAWEEGKGKNLACHTHVIMHPFSPPPFESVLVCGWQPTKPNLSWSFYSSSRLHACAYQSLYVCTSLTMHGQVPYENYRKVFRAQQRHIERELNPVATAVTNLAKTLEISSDGSSVEAAGVSATLDGMIARVETLRSKARFLVLLLRFELITKYHLAIGPSRNDWDVDPCRSS